MQNDNVTILVCPPFDNDLVQQIIDLSNRNRKWLGFLPADAFRSAAHTGQLLVAKAAADHSLLGYMFYRVAKQRVKVQHLCVQSGQRNAGVGRKLVDFLKKTTTHLDGICLHCAREFPAHDFWLHMGFTPVSEKRGRGISGRPLTFFWYDHGQPNLFRNSYKMLADATLTVVIDANVFFRLYVEHSRDDDECNALLADWLTDEISLWITEELFAEICRCNDDSLRNRFRSIAQGMARVEHDPQKFGGLVTELATLLGPANSRSDESDLRQLAMAISGNMHFFVTLDETLVQAGDKVSDRFDIQILRPSQLVTHLDEQQRAATYTPRSLAGASPIIQRVSSQSAQAMIDRFLDTGHGERKTVLKKNIHSLLSHPLEANLVHIETHTKDSLALSAGRHSGTAVYEVPLLRGTKHRLASTVLRHLIYQHILSSVNQSASLCRVTDNFLSKDAEKALRDFRFVRDKNGWAKVCLPNCLNVKDISATVDELCSVTPVGTEYRKYLESRIQIVSEDQGSPNQLAYLEQLLAPVKILDDRLPNFIVPIQPRWAQELFDVGLACRSLFPSDDLLALRNENVYYRSAFPPVLQAPSHVLWYVSDGAGSLPGPKAVRACSSVIEVTLGQPHDLYRRFHNYGVYELPNLLAIAKNDLAREIQCFRFSTTRLFANEIGLKSVREILTDDGRQAPPLMSPYKLSLRSFERIFKRGISQ